MAPRSSQPGYSLMAIGAGAVLAILSFGWWASDAIGPCEKSSAANAVAAGRTAVAENEEAALERDLLDRIGGALVNLTARVQASERAVLRVQRLQKLQQHPNAVGSPFMWQAAAQALTGSAAGEGAGEKEAPDTKEEPNGDGAGKEESDLPPVFVSSEEWSDAQVSDDDVVRVRLHIANLQGAPEGQILVRLHPEWAPLGAKRFLDLVSKQYFDRSRFHHVVDGIIARFGLSEKPQDFRYWLDRPIKDDKPNLRSQGNLRGKLAFAHDGANTRTCQVFVNLGDNEALDKQGFVPFAEVEEGMETLSELYAGYENKVKADLIRKMGKAYLDKWPQLSYIKNTEVIISRS